MKTSTAMKIRTAVSLSLFLCSGLLMLMAAPASAAAPAQGSTLPERLAGLMRDLDQDQSRRLGRVGGAATDSAGPFLPATLAQVAEIVDHHPDQTLVIFAKPRRAGQTRLDVDNSLLLASQGSAHSLDSTGRTRNAYVFEGPLDGDWNGLLASLGSSKPAGSPAIGKGQGLDALAKSKTAAFVFLLKTDPASKAVAVEKLILVPDTVMISFGGDASPLEPAASVVQNRQPSPPPSAPIPAPAVLGQTPVPVRPPPMPVRPIPPPHPEPPQMPPHDLPPPVEPPGDEDR